MGETSVKIENLSKLYRLGEVGTGTLSNDLNRWWAKLRGKEDPFSIVGQENDRSIDAKSDYVWALKDIDLEICQGDIFGIIGRNGAGKSTLLKIISRVTSPSNGCIKAKGNIASLLEVGTGMHPEMTARENIFLNGSILGMTRREVKSKFDDIIDFAGCKMYVDTPIKRFSSGMRVRLGFAVAAFLEPDILIVDEVLAVGDIEFQKRAIGKIKEVSDNNGRTVLFVSHNMGSVNNLCNKGVILDKGKISYLGSASDCVSEYMKSGVVEQENGVRSFVYDNKLAFQITKAYLETDKGERKQVYECDDTLSLKLHVNSSMVIPNLEGYINILSSDGTIVIASYSFDVSPNPLYNLSVGNQIIHINIPSRILGQGEYIIYENFTSNGISKSLIQRGCELISFKLIDSLRSRPDRRGYVSRSLNWKLE